MTRAFLLLVLASRLFAETPPAQPSPATVLNTRLPAWLKFGGDYRTRVEGFENGGFRPGNSDGYLLSRVRLDMTIKPASWLRIYAQGQDARTFWKTLAPPTAPFQDTFNLRQAYVEIGSTESWSIKTGRQEINFGEQRLVGSSNWINTARTFDAVLGTARVGKIRLTAFVASVVEITQSGVFHHHTQGNNLHGVVANMEKVIPGGVFEPYWFWRLSHTARDEWGRTGHLDMDTFGFRLTGKLPNQFSYAVEAARQTGSRGTDDISAWAGHWKLTRPLSTKGWLPAATAEYNYATGDGTPRDGANHTFETLYPTPHDKYGLADQVGWRNIHHIRAGLEVKPLAKLSLQSNYQNWWLADPRDALYVANGTPLTILPGGEGGSHVGQEVDIQGFYSLNKQTQLGLGIGHIFPGRFLRTATPGKSYTYPYAQAQYTF